MDKESAIISHFTSHKNGDDGAIVGEFTYSKDLFVEGTHFKKSWLTPRQIGAKAMLVNISDAVAMNATPEFALVGLGIPKNTSKYEIDELCSGLNDTAREFRIEIIGGDTIKSDVILISITIIARIRTHALRRNSAKEGDLLCFSGKLGDSLKGLQTLRNGGKIAMNSRFARPILRREFIFSAAHLMSAAMDISDGLASDLPKICGLRGVKFTRKLSKYELISGEEYEILFACPRKNLARIRSLARKNRIKITPFGKIVKGKCKIHGKFTHF